QVGLPFYSEDATRSHVLSWARSTSVASPYDRANEVATFNRRFEPLELAAGAGRRRGPPVERLTGSFDAWDRRLGPTKPEAPTPLGFGSVSSSIETRSQNVLLETIGMVDARWYEPSVFGQTLVLAAHGVAGTNVSRDFQAVIGGLSGLRAYPVAALAGRQL